MDEIMLLEDERIDDINENLKLIQKKRGLTFGTDAYLLAAFAKKMGKEIAADFGSGTGVASLLCASRAKYKHIYAFEVQPSFASLIDRNAEINGLTDKITTVGGDLRDTVSQFEAGSFGCVFSNPPYMPVGCGAAPASDEMNIARREENGTIFDFTARAASLIRYGGYFTTVYKPHRAGELFHALRQNGLAPKRSILVYPDIKSAPCLILTEAKKGGAPFTTFSRPLIIYKDTNHEDEERVYTDDMNRVYEEFSLEFLFKDLR